MEKTTLKLQEVRTVKNNLGTFIRYQLWVSG